VVCCHGNEENFDLDDSYDYLCKIMLTPPPRFGRFDSTEPNMNPPAGDRPDERPEPVSGSLPGSGLETKTVMFTAKERKIQGFIEKPHEKPQKIKMLVCRTAAKIYQVMLMCDEEDWSKYEAELNEIMGSFAVTGG